VNEGGLALQILKSAAFDIVILDVMLPGMTGFELIGRIKENEEIGNLYVLVVSAFDDTESVARCIQLGAEDYLPRDFEPIILRARIESCLEKKLLREMEALYIAAVTEGEKRLRAELQEGAAYVRGLLPARIDETGLASDWIFIPSLSLGGDAFGYHHVGADRTRFQLALYLIDVSGHGIEAALYSVTLMNLLKSQVLTGTDFADPASVLSHLNQSFRIEDQNNLFFSAWYGVWDGGTRELTYSSAGSPPALVRVANGSLIPLVTGGPIVGAIDDASYENRMEELTEGSALYLFSDGVFEIRQQDGRILGLEGFSGMLKEAAALDLGETLPALVVGLQGLSKSGRFEDDVSLLEFRFG
jgi:sigma-B regulation protein RsbU (phosphoserine phosphatase)